MGESRYRTYFGSLRVLEARVGGHAGPVNVGLTLHVLDDSVEQESLLSGRLLGLARASARLGRRLGRHLALLSGGFFYFKLRRGSALAMGLSLLKASRVLMEALVSEE